MSGRIAKSQIPVKSQRSLRPEAKVALIQAKNDLRNGVNLQVFQNARGGLPGEGPPLPGLDLGCIYHEIQVGQAHPDDPRGAGRFRLVVEVVQSSGQIREVYYTEYHYAKNTFYRIVF